MNLAESVILNCDRNRIDQGYLWGLVAFITSARPEGVLNRTQTANRQLIGGVLFDCQGHFVRRPDDLDGRGAPGRAGVT